MPATTNSLTDETVEGTAPTRAALCEHTSQRRGCFEIPRDGHGLNCVPSVSEAGTCQPPFKIPRTHNLVRPRHQVASLRLCDSKSDKTGQRLRLCADKTSLNAAGKWTKDLPIMYDCRLFTQHHSILDIRSARLPKVVSQHYDSAEVHWSSSLQRHRDS